MTKIEKFINTLVIVSIITSMILGHFELLSLKFIFVFLTVLGVFSLCVIYGFKVLSASNIILFTLLSLNPLGSILKILHIMMADPILAFGQTSFVLVSIYILFHEWKNQKRKGIISVSLLVILSSLNFIWLPPLEIKFLLQLAILFMVLWQFPYKSLVFNKSNGYLNIIGLTSSISLVLSVSS